MRTRSRFRGLAGSAWFWAGAALAVRLTLLAVLAPQIDPERINFVDDLDYHRLGRDWAATGHYAIIRDGVAVPEVSRVPLYPAYLAGVYGLFGVRPVAAVLGQLVFQAITCGLVVHLARRVAPGRQMWAGLIAASDPIAIVYGYVLYSDSLFTLLLVVASWVIVMRPSARRSWLTAGVGLGLATLVRPNGLTLLPALLLLLPKGSAKRWLTFVLAAAVGFLVVVTPWLVRNYRVTGRVMLTDWDSRYLAWATPTGFGDESERSQPGIFVLRAVRGLLLNHAPTGGKMLATLSGIPVTALPGTVGESHQPFAGPALWQVLREKSRLEWAFIGYSTAWLAATLAAALLSMVREARRFRGRRWFLAAVPLILVFSLSFRGQARYRMPADPFYAVLAAITIGVALRLWWARRGKARTRGA